MDPNEAFKTFQKDAPHLAADPSVAANFAALVGASAIPTRRIHGGWLTLALLLLGMALLIVVTAVGESTINGGVITGVGLLLVGARAAWRRARNSSNNHVTRQSAPKNPSPPRTSSLPPIAPRRTSSLPPIAPRRTSSLPPIALPFAHYAQNTVETRFQDERCTKADVFGPDGRRWVFLVLGRRVLYQPADAQLYQTAFTVEGQTPSGLAAAMTRDIVDGSEETISRDVLDGPWR